MSNTKINVVFLGTPDFSIPTLELLNNHPQINLSHVVTMPSRPAGRGRELTPPPIAEFAIKHKLPFLQTENINLEEDFIKQCKNDKVDLFIVIAFAQFLKQELLDIPTKGAFNIHTSLLPKYRGAAPIQHALLNDESETGVTIQKMVKKMDAGDIVHQHEISIAKTETCSQLYTRLKFLAANSCNDFIIKIIENTLTPKKQDESRITFAPTLQKDDGFIDFTKYTAHQVVCRVRALSIWPGTYCFLGKHRMKIIDASIYDLKLNPNEACCKFGCLVVGCSEGSVRLNTVQITGKKACSDQDFLNGVRDEITINPN